MSAVRHEDGICRCHWCGSDPLYVTLSRHRMGRARIRLARTVREAACSTASRRGCRGSPSCASAIISAPRSMALNLKSWRATMPRRLKALMQDQGIVRNRLKIDVRHQCAGLSGDPGFLRLSLGLSRWQAVAERQARRQHCPAKTPLAEKISKDLKKRGFRFVGPTIVYAFMQACGLVNDHLVDCHRHEAVKKPLPPNTPRPAPGSACCRAAGSICSIRRRSTSRSRTSPTASPAWRAGTARPRATMPSRWPSIACRGGYRLSHLTPAARAARRLAALLHDAPEYVIGDMISPFKAALGVDYKAFENRLMAAIHCRRSRRRNASAYLPGRQ
jgi:DNA-3-methyladenine glycosylase I